MTKYDHDVLIAGAGVPGMALGVLLARAGFSVMLIDAGPAVPVYDPARPDGRTVALMGGSVGILAQAGIESAIHAWGSPLEKMAVVDDSRFPAGADAMVEQVFDAAEMSRENFGWNVPLPALRAALHGEIKKYKNITFMTRTSLADGKARCALLVGTDGRDSAVRKKAGIEATRKSYGQTAITCVLGHSQSHRNTSTEFHRPGGPFTIVPMQGKTCAIVWVEKDEDAKEFLKLPRPAMIRVIEARTRGKIGQISLLTDPVSWPLEYLRAQTLTGPRMVLAAEAAHVLSPIGAQGLNLSLRDVRDLADVLISARDAGLDIGSHTVLEQYAKMRAGDIHTRVAAIDFTNRMVASDSEGMRGLRRLTLRALSLPGPLRKLVMKKGLAA